jgi:methylglutaconyl-CoA hydratase
MSPILYSVAGGIGRIALNRPDKRNALNDELISGLKHHLREAASDAAVKVIAIAGEGKDFCSGADLAGLEKMFDATVLDHMHGARQMAEAFLAMRRCPKPVVALVKGKALAGGCGLATACDLILAADTAQFGYPEVNIGFVPAMVMAILRRNLGEKLAFELIAGGEPVSAARAREIGLVNQVYPEADFDARAAEYLAKLAGKSASAMLLSKNLLYQMDGMSFEAALESGVHMNAIARLTPDMKKGIEKFLKRG